MANPRSKDCLLGTQIRNLPTSGWQTSGSSTSANLMYQMKRSCQLPVKLMFFTSTWSYVHCTFHWSSLFLKMNIIWCSFLRIWHRDSIRLKHTTLIESSNILQNCRNTIWSWKDILWKKKFRTCFSKIRTERKCSSVLLQGLNLL